MAAKRILSHRLRAILCTALILQVNLPGCSVPPGPELDAWLSVPLSPEHPISIALEGTSFAGAGTIEINPALMAFRLLSVDGSRSMSGAMGARGAQAAVRTFRISSASASIDFVLDSYDHITRISSGAGRVWTRVVDDSSTDPDLSLFDSYLAVNEEIVNAAEMMDENPDGQVESPGPSQDEPIPSAKTAVSDQSINSALTNLLGVLTALVGPQFIIANLPALYFAFQVFVSLSFTFDVLGISPLGNDGASGNDETPSGNPIPPTQTGNNSGNNFSSANATLRVSNVLTNGVPIWYVVPVPGPGEAAFGNLLGNGAIPAGESRDFKLPAGTRTINILCPDKGDCLRVYQKFGIQLINGETVDVMLSSIDIGQLYPADCGGG